MFVCRKFISESLLIDFWSKEIQQSPFSRHDNNGDCFLVFWQDFRVFPTLFCTIYENYKILLVNRHFLQKKIYLGWTNNKSHGFSRLLLSLSFGREIVQIKTSHQNLAYNFIHGGLYKKMFCLVKEQRFSSYKNPIYKWMHTGASTDFIIHSSTDLKCPLFVQYVFDSRKTFENAFIVLV